MWKLPELIKVEGQLQKTNSAKSLGNRKKNENVKIARIFQVEGQYQKTYSAKSM